MSMSFRVGDGGVGGMWGMGRESVLSRGKSKNIEMYLVW